MRVAASIGLALICVACTPSVPIADRVEFAPRDVEPRCDVPATAPPEALHERDVVLEQWNQARTELAAWHTLIAALADDLGVHGGDESLVIETITGGLEQLSAAGCAVSCADANHGCTVLAVKCADDPGAQRRAETLVSVVNRDWPKLYAFGEDERTRVNHRVRIDGGTLIRATRGRRCDLNPPLVWPASAFGLGAVLASAAQASTMKSCPISMAACRKQCDAGDFSKCGYALSDPALSEDDKFDLRVKLCDRAPPGPANVWSTDPQSHCMLAVTTQVLTARPALRERAEAFAERLCTGAVPSAKCAYAGAGLAGQTWFRARPLYGRLVEKLADQCAAMGAATCALLASSFYADKKSLLGADTRAKIAPVMRAGCDAGDWTVCLGLTGLGDAVSPADRGRAVVRACELDVNGCFTAAACFGPGNHDGCGELGMDAGQQQQAYERACANVRAAKRIVAGCKP